MSYFLPVHCFTAKVSRREHARKHICARKEPNAALAYLHASRQSGGRGPTMATTRMRERMSGAGRERARAQSAWPLRRASGESPRRESRLLDERALFVRRFMEGVRAR